MELAELNCQVNPILTKDYSTLAKRPQYSVLDKENIKLILILIFHIGKNLLKNV